ncbi:MAG: isoleucine--tRNA ligase [Pirellulales bacterium]|nr:isoleucine--tRNA ligase [Pirellulales bacterium]
MFQPVNGTTNFPAQEEAILQLWREREIYDKSLAHREGCPDFVFYEGPPTANGMPHPGHCLTRAIKDLFPRYRTMRGDHCIRKAGWDTHGLPVEVEVCKELGIHSKEEIEDYGIERFIHKCQRSVWRYMREWERLTERLGFWIHLNEAYVTYHQSYVESVWWSLKTLFDRGLLYQGHKIVWWWAQGGTALSAGEVGQGYREVADPSVFVRFPLLDENNRVTDTALLVWTTTPWTLPSNQFVAVHPEIDYATVIDPGDGKEVPPQRLVVALELADSIAKKVKRPLTIESRYPGAELIGRRYVPPFDYYYKRDKDVRGTLRTPSDSRQSARTSRSRPTKIPSTQHVAWRIVPADFVTTDSGSGLVHQAPAFGEVDYDLLLSEQERFVDGEGPQLINAVAPDGSFTEVTHNDDPHGLLLEGRWVKDCDKEINRDMRARGLLYHQEQYLHDYPFCWRAEEDPLIQYPRKSWFIRTTAMKDRMLANNAEINWLPEHIKGGRFGNFLESNIDWALSRERYWGSPLPIWQCEETGYQEAISSYEELLAKPGVQGTEVWNQAKADNPDLPDDLRVHKPYIDYVTYDSPKALGARMRRVSEVIDCWYDSGAMPFAQWGWRGQSKGDIAWKFLNQFPADFISEALDQTRGWFYSMLAISTLLFSEETTGFRKGTENQIPQFPYPHPYRNCIVLGLMLGEDGQKMSKSKRNYREPDEIFNRYGADALRWYFFSNQPPWTGIRYNEQAIKESIPEFLLRLWNVYSFFVIYANIDGFDPAEHLSGNVGQLDGSRLRVARTCRPIARRCELDRWILGELDTTAADMIERMDAYDNYAACQKISAFVDALSNWYVRRSRDRFWASDKQSPEKLDAYWTLYECLVTTTRLIAPFTPFLAEAIWQNLAVAIFGDRTVESVHLSDYPTSRAMDQDQDLSTRMGLVREIASLGHSARNNAKIKVRQPLAKVEVVLTDTTHLEWLTRHTALIEDELNVKAVEFTTHGEEYISYSVVPNFKRLGPRLGKNMPEAKKILGQANGAELLAELKNQGHVTVILPDQNHVKLDREDIEIRMAAKEGWAAAEGRQCVVVLSTELTESLVQEGIARDVTRAIQDARKALDCQYTDRIRLGIVTEAQDIQAAISNFADYIQEETLAIELTLKPIPGVERTEVQIGGQRLDLSIQVVS